jgi:flagellar biosynthesis/type III secretory pathway M-ring protein FliF/YscJ
MQLGFRVLDAQVASAVSPTHHAPQSGIQGWWATLLLLITVLTVIIWLIVARRRRRRDEEEAEQDWAKSRHSTRV